jgi:hypothetical protein
MKNIPKKIYFYWGAEIMPYLRFMTIYTARKFNPDWYIILNIPKNPSKNYNWPGKENKNDLTGSDYMPLAHRLVDEVRTIDMEQFGLANDLPEVTKSDYLRLHLLANEGGLWLDMDIVFFRPISYAFLPTDHLTYVCYQPHKPGTDPYHSIGLLAGGQGNQTWPKLLQHAKEDIGKYDYQAIGSPYYAKHVDVSLPEVCNISNNIVYPNRWPEKIWNDSAQVSLQGLRPETIGIHWYAGHPISAKFQQELTEGNFQGYDNLVCHYLAQVLAR